MRSHIAKLDFDPVVGELMLNHAISDELEKAYKRYDFWPERIAAAEH